MRNNTADLAQSITWTGSKQTYYTARIIVDKDLANDFYRALPIFAGLMTLLTLRLGLSSVTVTLRHMLRRLSRQRGGADETVVDCGQQAVEPSQRYG